MRSPILKQYFEDLHSDIVGDTDESALQRGELSTNVEKGKKKQKKQQVNEGQRDSETLPPPTLPVQGQQHAEGDGRGAPPPPPKIKAEGKRRAVYQFLRLLLWHTENLQLLCDQTTETLNTFLGDPGAPLQGVDLLFDTMDGSSVMLHVQTQVTACSHSAAQSMMKQ